jgi:hypothetical protein
MRAQPRYDSCAVRVNLGLGNVISQLYSPDGSQSFQLAQTMLGLYSTAREFFARIIYSKLTLSSAGRPRCFSLCRKSRHFATVAEPPVRRYGGLKDQDRIFTNAYCRHDHGLKGAKVCPQRVLRLPSRLTSPSHAETGTAPKTSCSKATRGLFRQSKTRVYVVVVGQASPVVSNGAS